MALTKLWTLQFEDHFNKQLYLLEKKYQQRIIDFFEDRVLQHHNPKTLAKPLSGSLRGYWRFRVGDYRIIADIQDDDLIIVAIEVGHRKDIYH